MKREWYSKDQNIFINIRTPRSYIQCTQLTSRSSKNRTNTHSLPWKKIIPSCQSRSQYAASLNPRAFILNTDLVQAAGQWRLFSDVATQYISDAASYGVLGCYWRPIFSMTGKTRLVCGALCRSVISIADAGFCRRQFQQTQGSPVSTAWLKCNSCAWEILKRALLCSNTQRAYFLRRYVATPPAQLLCSFHKYTQGLDPHGFVFNGAAQNCLKAADCYNILQDIRYQKLMCECEVRRSWERQRKKRNHFWMRGNRSTAETFTIVRITNITVAIILIVYVKQSFP